MSKYAPLPKAHKVPEPAISSELILWLEKNYPDKVQDIAKPQREADAYVGTIQLIRKLRDMHNRQYPKVLPGS